MTARVVMQMRQSVLGQRCFRGCLQAGLERHGWMPARGERSSTLKCILNVNHRCQSQFPSEITHSALSLSWHLAQYFQCIHGTHEFLQCGYISFFDIVNRHWPKNRGVPAIEPQRIVLPSYMPHSDILPPMPHTLQQSCLHQ